MVWFIAMVVVYFSTLALFAFYSFSQMKDAQRFCDWCSKADTELKGVRELTVALEARVKKMEEALGPIDPEPDFQVKGGR